MIGIFQGSPEGRANECQRRAKGGQKEGFPGQRPKSRAKEGHGRAPSQKQGSLAAMVEEEGNFPTFLGWFWVRVINVAHVRPSSKMGPKTKICT